MSSENEWFKYGFKPFPRRKEIGHPDNEKRFYVCLQNVELVNKLILAGKPHPNILEIIEMEE